LFEAKKSRFIEESGDKWWFINEFKNMDMRYDWWTDIQVTEKCKQINVSRILNFY
jgi:hypothetical protein